MLRSGHVLKIHELRAQNKSIRQIAMLTGHSKNTVKKYLKLRELPQPKPRTKRQSKLDPFMTDLNAWLNEGILNCEVLFERLQAMGYSGGRTILRSYVHRFRPPTLPKAVMRYETAPGEQAQVDWGVLKYKDLNDREKHIYAFVYTLGYSRDQYVECVRHMDISTFLRCFVHALEYFGGVPQTVLFDNMKTVRIGTDEEEQPILNPLFAEFAVAMGFVPKLCRPRRPQTKGKVENGVKYLKRNFWPGRRFTDDVDLNHQVLGWCHKVSQRIHGTTGERPCDRRASECFQPLPAPTVMAKFVTETRLVSRDGYVSFDGSRYGVPWQLVGQDVQVRQIGAYVEVLHQGKIMAQLPKALLPKTIVPLPGQYQDIPLAQAPRYSPPGGVQVPSPEVETRSLLVYENLAGGDR